jgi:transposase InsO family protein
MVWRLCDTMSLRREFVELASQESANLAELCRRFGIARKTGYKWLTRFRVDGAEGLRDRSRRPQESPESTPAELVTAILEIRDAHPAWGGRKIRQRLLNLKHRHVPAASTISGILKREGRVSDEASRRAQAFISFERAQPNELWQMDFKGHFPMSLGGRCHPLTILDDHSRFSLGLRALDNEQGLGVQRELTAIFRRFGLPEAMLMDNGPPWGPSREEGFTWLNVWMMDLGIRVLHSRPGHPQTNGKDERFHRTLDIEVLHGNSFRDLVDTQRRFDPFRECYNHERPHQALNFAVPASRYQTSPRTFPEKIASWEYAPDVTVRKVDATNRICWQGGRFKIGLAFRGKPVGVRATTTDGQFHVYYCNTKIKTINLNQ